MKKSEKTRLIKLNKMSVMKKYKTLPEIFGIDFYIIHDKRELYEKMNIVRFVNEDEFVTAKKLMNYVFEIMTHKRKEEDTLNNYDSMQYIMYARSKHVSLNCYTRSYILRDLLHSCGLPARMIYCLPLNCDYNGNHVVVEVYIERYKKWIMLDASYDLFFLSEDKTPLSLIEIKDSIEKERRITIFRNNRFEFYNNNQIDDEEYYDMITPLLKVLQYENNSGGIKYIRLVQRGYKLPFSNLEYEKKQWIIYTDDRSVLY